MALTLNQLAITIQAITHIGKAIKYRRPISPYAIGVLEHTGWDERAITWLTSDINNTRRAYLRAVAVLRARVTASAPDEQDKELETL